MVLGQGVMQAALPLKCHHLEDSMALKIPGVDRVSHVRASHFELETKQTMKQFILIALLG